MLIITKHCSRNNSLYRNSSEQIGPTLLHGSSPMKVASIVLKRCIYPIEIQGGW